MNTRWVAVSVITRILGEGQSLTTALDNALKAVESAQDKAFIQAICYGVCRNYHRLDFTLNALVDKPLKSLEVKALLLIGLFQLSFMRVKPHAAVSETVQAATRSLPWAKALVNAVLRTYIRKENELEQQANAVKTAAFSHPDWLVERFKNDWPDHAEQLMFENNQAPPMTLRVNLAKTSREDYLRLLAKQSITAQTVGFCPSALILEKPTSVETLPGFAKGWASVQDGAAQLAAGLLDVQASHRVLDICAAPGGKTAHILEMHPALKTLVAIDIDGNRMLRVQENLHRLEQKATLIVADATDTKAWWDGKAFDRILLDAPCSATGVIRRHPDIKLLRRAEDLAALTATQNRILNAVWPLLAKGGMLLYATCSVLLQENEAVVGEFIASHPDANELPITTNDWGMPSTVGRQILTGESSMDGFYYARICKQ